LRSGNGVSAPSHFLDIAPAALDEIRDARVAVERLIGITI
jgi:hypothetical protein